MRNIFRAVKRIIVEHDDVQVVYPVHLNPLVQNWQTKFSGTIRGFIWSNRWMYWISITSLLEPIWFWLILRNPGRSTVTWCTCPGFKGYDRTSWGDCGWNLKIGWYWRTNHIWFGTWIAHRSRGARKNVQSFKSIWGRKCFGPHSWSHPLLF